MEEAQYWTWTKRRKSRSISSYGDSWEEQAFAEDTAGLLGGCVWPPRSYSCSFCRREFKSAQALGGHMNVHRRDRARLKQSTSTTPNNEFLHASHACTLGYNPSSDSKYHGFVESPSSPSRVSSAPTIKLKCDENTCLDRARHDDKSILNEEPKHSNDKKSNCKVNSKYGDLSVRLNLVIRQTQLPTVCNDDYKSVTCKRRRIDAAVSFFPEVASSEDAESEVIELNSNSLEDIDLELRLGYN